jgi:hypothetical protein
MGGKRTHRVQLSGKPVPAGIGRGRTVTWPVGRCPSCQLSGTPVPAGGTRSSRDLAGGALPIVSAIGEVRSGGSCVLLGTQGYPRGGLGDHLRSGVGEQTRPVTGFQAPPPSAWFRLREYTGIVPVDSGSGLRRGAVRV